MQSLNNVLDICALGIYSLDSKVLIYKNLYWHYWICLLFKTVNNVFLVGVVTCDLKRGHWLLTLNLKMSGDCTDQKIV